METEVFAYPLTPGSDPVGGVGRCSSIAGPSSVRCLGLRAPTDPTETPL